MLGQCWQEHFGKEVAARNPETVFCGGRVERILCADQRFDTAQNFLQRFFEREGELGRLELLSAAKEQLVAERQAKPFQRSGYGWLGQAQTRASPNGGMLNQQRIEHTQKVQIETG